MEATQRAWDGGRGALQALCGLIGLQHLKVLTNPVASQSLSFRSFYGGSIL